MLRRLSLILVLLGASPALWAQAISPELQVKVDKFKTELSKWAANPVVVSAAEKSNAAGGLPGMTPAKWTELDDKSAEVQSIMASEAGKYVDKLDGPEINKVVVRDKLGNAVAANTKVVLYNVTHRPVFKNAITGTPWQQDTVAKDVTTQKLSVQIAVPIKTKGGDIIGVMHASINAQ
jgi:hypothetical protein